MGVMARNRYLALIVALCVGHASLAEESHLLSAHAAHTDHDHHQDRDPSSPPGHSSEDCSICIILSHGGKGLPSEFPPLVFSACALINHPVTPCWVRPSGQLVREIIPRAPPGHITPSKSF